MIKTKYLVYRLLFVKFGELTMKSTGSYFNNVSSLETRARVSKSKLSESIFQREMLHRTQFIKKVFFWTTIYKKSSQNKLQFEKKL